MQTNIKFPQKPQKLKTTGARLSVVAITLSLKFRVLSPENYQNRKTVAVFADGHSSLFR
jgi:hypothetical protein